MNDREFAESPPSRTARKKASKEIEALARQLADLSETERLALPVDDHLRDEIREAAATKGRGSHKRQIKYLAGLLRKRSEDAEALQQHMEGLHVDQLQDKAAFHKLEELRDRLCDPVLFEAALQEVGETFPSIEERQIARLARSVHSHGDKKAFREIFRRLREGVD